MSTPTTALVRSAPSGNSTAINNSGPQTNSTPLSSTLATTTTQPRSMSTPSSQSTPSKVSTPSQQQQQQQQQQPQQPSPATSTPGRWQHPRMEEILRRQNRSKFDQNNGRPIAYSIGGFLLTFIIHAFIARFLPSNWLQLLNPYLIPALNLLRGFLVLNTLPPLLPLLRTPDKCEDIPLTPSQRHLLGLPPLSRPATPQEKEQYVTPPRYTANTPRGSGSSAGSVRGGSGGAGGAWTMTRSASGSPLTPGGLQVRGAGAETRKLSYNSTRSSPLSISEFDTMGGSVNSPTAGIMGKREHHHHRASVGLNSKWLYEKGKAGTGVGIGGSGWGTGSVFS